MRGCQCKYTDTITDREVNCEDTTKAYYCRGNKRVVTDEQIIYTLKWGKQHT